MPVLVLLVWSVICIVMLLRFLRRAWLRRHGMPGIAFVEKVESTGTTSPAGFARRLTLNVVRASGTPFRKIVRWIDPSRGESLFLEGEQLPVRCGRGSRPGIVLDLRELQATGRIDRIPQQWQTGAVMVFIFAALLAPAILTAPEGLSGDGTVKGQMTAQGQIGNWTLTPDACVSGDHDGFHGVTLRTSAGGHSVMVVHDPIDGDLVAVSQPATDHVVRLSRANCTKFDMNVSENGVVYNRVAELKGHIDLECSTPAATLSGDVTFDGCHR